MILLNHKNHSPQSWNPGRYRIKIRRIEKLLHQIKAAIETRRANVTCGLCGDIAPAWTPGVCRGKTPDVAHPAQDQQSRPPRNLLPICIVNAVWAPLYPSGGYRQIIYLLCCLKITFRNINANLNVKRWHHCRYSDWGMFSTFINAK